MFEEKSSSDHQSKKNVRSETEIIKSIALQHRMCAVHQTQTTGCRPYTYSQPVCKRVRQDPIGGCQMTCQFQTGCLRFAKIQSADADHIPNPKRQLCGSPRSNQRMHTTYPIPNGNYAVRQDPIGRCKPHTHSQTATMRFAKIQSADAA